MLFRFNMSIMSLWDVMGLAPCLISVFGPSDSGEVIFVGSANMGLLNFLASLAVIIVPDFWVHSVIMTRSANFAINSFLCGKVARFA